MGRSKVISKKLPPATSKDVVESSESNHVPIQRKRGRPRKVVKENLPIEEQKTEETKAQLAESAETGKKRKKPKLFVEQTSSGPVSKGGHGEEDPLKPKIGRWEGSRRKSEPRRAAEDSENPLTGKSSDYIVEEEVARKDISTQNINPLSNVASCQTVQEAGSIAKTVSTHSVI